MQIVMCFHQYFFEHAWNDITKNNIYCLELIYEIRDFFLGLFQSL